MPTATDDHDDHPATDVTVRAGELEALGVDANGRAELAGFTNTAVWALILLRTIERNGTYHGDKSDDRVQLRGLIATLETLVLPRMLGIRDAAVRRHSILGGTYADLASAMGVARSTAQTRAQALMTREPSEDERWARGLDHQADTEPATHAITLNVDRDADFVLTEALREFAARQRHEAADCDADATDDLLTEQSAASHTANAQRLREQAAAADALLEQIDASLDGRGDA